MKDEIQKQLLVLLNRLNTPEQKAHHSKIGVFLNSPFFLTFLGGILITCGSLLLESRISEGKEQGQRQRDAERRQQEFVTVFASGGYRSLSHSYGMRQREIWLGQQQGSQTKETHYVDGRSFSETRDIYEKQFSEYLAAQPIDALLPQAVFHFPALKTKIEDFEKVFEAYLTCKKQDELDRLIDELTASHKALVRAMLTPNPH